MSLNKARTSDSLYSYIFPLLTGLFPILYLFTANITQVELSVLTRPLLITIAVVISLTLLLRLILKNPTRSSLITAAIVILFFSYGHISSYVDTIHIGKKSIADYLMFLWIILLLRAVHSIWTNTQRLQKALPAFTLVSAGLVIFQVISIVFNYQGGIFNKNTASSNLASATNAVSAEGPIAGKKYPDIYYIILDCYPRNDTLSYVFNFDNSEFLNGLEQRGFYVASQSSSNYVMTFLSLSSSLNMQYHDQEQLKAEGTDRSLPNRMIQNSKIASLLHQYGYNFINVSSGWGPTDIIPHADENIKFTELSEFNLVLLKTTALEPFINYTTQEDKRMLINFTFDRLQNMPSTQQPRFIFAHMLIPHPPYVFNKDGSAPDILNTSYMNYLPEYKPAFLNQMEYANGQVLQLVDKILQSNPDNPPVIVIQGDHGSSFGDRSGVLKEGPWFHAMNALASGEIDQYSIDYLRERSDILNVYYFPGEAKKLLYPYITPVNTFRVIADAYLGTHLGLLEDKTEFSTYEDLYEFHEVPPEILRLEGTSQ